MSHKQFSPYLLRYFYKKIHLLIKNISKEKLFLQNIKTFLFKTRHPYISSSCEVGSYTVEVAVLLPLFLVFAMLILFCLRAVYTQWKVGVTMDEVVNQGALINSDKVNKELLYGMFLAESKKNEVPVDFVAGGWLGFGMTGSYVEDNVIHLKISYRLTYPIRLLGKQGFSICQNRSARIWNGYDPTQDKSGESYVYVAKYGTVYHTSRYCPHIDPTIQTVSREELKRTRNLSGGKYKNCPYCGGESNYYYITVWGDCYHSNITCSALSRSVFRMTLKEAKEVYGCCTKCGK